MPILVSNGWTLFSHPLFERQVADLEARVRALKEKYPDDYLRRNATKRLAAIYKLAREVIPRDPASPEFRQGATLGEDHKHWRRAKFFQQYRLFFRFHTTSKIIVYAWVNDKKNKRAYNSKSDAYRVFSKMLDSGNPPDNWDHLITESMPLPGEVTER